MSLMLEKICALQKQYGKTPAELEVLVEGFYWALEEYDIEKITEAMKLYIKKNNDIPAPADIIAIIKDIEKKQYVDDISITTDTLIRYVEKGIPLSLAQKKRLISLEIMSDNGDLIYANYNKRL